ncbi:MAG: tRNA pseudouridine(55) synthase TruB, partial [Candidatus Promineifilaceae bacterium]|nr:tRNA pseudouridine(55) synthase TruB [Candidatus Promineifilaceae bacterium]
MTIQPPSVAPDTAGLINIDKPAGLTSHDVVRQVRRIADMRRVGHTGTLDPLATGVLIVCLGRATRLAEYVVDLRKVYVTTVRLGQSTTTYDTEGQLTNERPVNVDQAQIQAALAQFRGPIQQVPPLYSALKKDGVPLYQHARSGHQVERPARQVTVYELTVLAWQTPHLTLRVACSSGTYIRSLAHDLGEALGCGGHVVALRRTQVGSFSAEHAIPLDQLSAANLDRHLQPPDRAVTHLPEVRVDNDEAVRLLQGQTLPRTDRFQEL